MRPWLDAGGSWNRDRAAPGCATSSRPHLTFTTDFRHPSGKIFALDRHVQDKAHTLTIESLNNRIRCYLARLKRRTHSYSKSLENLAASILFIIVKKSFLEKSASGNGPRYG